MGFLVSKNSNEVKGRLDMLSTALWPELEQQARILIELIGGTIIMEYT